MQAVLLRTGGTFVPCVVFWDHRSNFCISDFCLWSQFSEVLLSLLFVYTEFLPSYHVRVISHFRLGALCWTTIYFGVGSLCNGLLFSGFYLLIVRLVVQRNAFNSADATLSRIVLRHSRSEILSSGV